MSDTLKVDVIGTSKKADLPAALFGLCLLYPSRWV